MKRFTAPASRFQISKFLDTLADGTGLPLEEAFGVVVEDRVHFDPIDVAMALAEDEHDVDEEDEEQAIPYDPVARLERGLTIFAHFAMPNAEDGYDCADGAVIEVPDLDEEDVPRTSKKVQVAVENTPAGECWAWGYLIRLAGKTIIIDAGAICDSSGECCLEEVVSPNLFDEPMAKFVRLFRRSPALAKRMQKRK